MNYEAPINFHDADHDLRDSTFIIIKCIVHRQQMI